MNSYYRNIRDPEALAKEKEDYNKRVSTTGKTTTFSIFNFFFTTERESKKRAALEANPEKLAEYEARRSAREVQTRMQIPFYSRSSAFLCTYQRLVSRLCPCRVLVYQLMLPSLHTLLSKVGGTKEDQDKIATNMRRASHAELAAAKDQWDRRKDGETGTVQERRERGIPC